MFRSSQPFLFFDHWRIPYEVTGATSGRLESISAGERTLLWPVELPQPAHHRLGSIPLFTGVVGDETVRELLGEKAAGWRAEPFVETAHGEHAASIWRDANGSVLLPFDPSSAISSFWSEAYKSREGGRSVMSIAKWAYYRLRPLLPRRVQIAMRRRFSRVQARTRFPAWPAETALHDLFELLFQETARLAGQPVPYVAPWPRGRTWALVLTHDVETRLGYENLGLLREIEAAAGFRSSWNFVPRRYEVDEALVDDLWKGGFEVGVHGLYHDGRDLESRKTLEERLPAIREYAERWRAVGFRSPATRRKWELMPLLGFDYDSSYPDTDPFEPDAGGCCTWLPFFNKELVELPITLPQDHTLFVILERDEALWVEKAELLREQGGMALLITHPDYMLDEERLEAYRRFLQRFEGDGGLWRALPQEVSSWWRRRARSRIEASSEGWTVAGPAAGEAALRLYGD
jgi:hypothetical protein